MKVIFSFILILIIAPLTAQKDHSQQKERLKHVHKSFINSKLELDNETAVLFWEMYYEMKSSLRNDHKQKMKLFHTDYVSDEDAHILIDKILDLKKHNYKIKDEFRSKTIDLIGPAKYLEFQKAEHEFKYKVVEKIKTRRPQDGGL